MKRFAFGWGIVVTCFMLAFVDGVFNLQVANFLINPIQQEMSWARSSVLFLFLLQTLFYIAATLGFGFLIDKIGARPIVVISSVCLWLSFMILAKLQNYVPFLIYFSIFAGIGFAGIGKAVIYTVLGKWFRARRGMMLAFSLLGSSFSVAALQPVIQAAADSGAGWRSYWWVFSFFPLICVLPLAVLFLRREPADSGYTPFFSQHRFLCDEEKKDPVESYSPLQILRMRSFWLILFSWLFSTLGGNLIHIVIFPFATQKGITVWTHPSFMALIFFCVPIGMLFFGILSDFVSTRVLTSILCSVQALSLLLFMIFGNRVLFYALPGIAGGMTAGGLLATMPLLMMKYFGPRHLGKIAGIMTAVCSLADLATVFYMRSFHETIESYGGVFVASILLVTAAGILVAFAGRPNRRQA